MILESRTTDAIQKYGIEKVNAIIQRDNALCSKYILPICRYVYDEKNDINEVLPVIRMVDKTQGIDIYSLSFDDLRNQLNVNKPDDYIPLPNPFYFSSDKTVEIGHITSWDESKEIPQAKSWCISRKEESWDDFVKNRGYRFFIIRDSKCFYKKNARHVIVTVAKNGSWWFVDSDDDTMVDYHIGNRGDHHMLKSDYVKSIGEGAMKAIQDKITTNENKRYKNMDRKNIIRLTESELKNIIAESVKNVLRENNSFHGMPNTEVKVDDEGDKILLWHGCEMDYWEVENYLYREYEYEMEELNQTESEEGFEIWLNEKGEEYIADILGSLFWPQGAGYVTESKLKKVITESIKKVLNEGKNVNNKHIFSKGFDLAKPGDKACGIDNSEFFKSKGYKTYRDAKTAVERGELSKEIFDKWIDDLKKGLETHNERVDKYSPNKHSVGYGTDNAVSLPTWGRAADYRRFDDRMRDLKYDLDMKRLKRL